MHASAFSRASIAPRFHPIAPRLHCIAPALHLRLYNNSCPTRALVYRWIGSPLLCQEVNMIPRFLSLKRRAERIRAPWLSSHKLGRPFGLAARWSRAGGIA